MTRRTFDPAAIEPADTAKLLMGLVVPRPIGWIGTTGPGGDNLAPFSFFNLAVTDPPIVLFCPGRSRRDKDSLVNAVASGEFTVNVVTDATAEAMNLTSGGYAPDVDEFTIAGLTKVTGQVVAAPMVDESVASFECRVLEVHDLGEGPAVSVVYGEVVMIHVDDAVLDGTRIRFDRLGAVGRLAGPWYSRTNDLFRMERPEGGG